MSDQCQYCIYVGDINKCLKSECFLHKNWIVSALVKKLSRTKAGPPREIKAKNRVLRYWNMERSHYFDKGWKEGAAAVRKNISKFKVGK
jgi:hypothetical protein